MHRIIVAMFSAAPTELIFCSLTTYDALKKIWVQIWPLPTIYRDFVPNNEENPYQSYSLICSLI
jgi:hypothetical protein